MGAVDNRRMCPNCRAFVTTSDRVCPYCQAPLGARAVERRNPGEILGGLIPHARFTTVMILLINTALFLVQTYVPQSGITQAGQSVPVAYMDGQWWRLVTAGFLHGGYSSHPDEFLGAVRSGRRSGNVVRHQPADHLLLSFPR